MGRTVHDLRTFFLENYGVNVPILTSTGRRSNLFDEIKNRPREGNGFLLKDNQVIN